MATLDFSKYVLEKKEDIQAIADAVKGYTESTKEMTVTDIKNDMNTFVSRILDRKLTGTLVIPEGLTSVDTSGMNYITKLILPSTLKTIGGYALQNNYGLTELVLPEGLHTIGSQALSGCKNIKSLTLPQSITKLGSNAFAGCTGMTTINVPFSSDSDLATYAPWGAVNATVNYNFGNNIYEAKYDYGEVEGSMSSYPYVFIEGNDIRPANIISSGDNTETYTTDILIIDTNGIERTATYSLILTTGSDMEGHPSLNGGLGGYFYLTERIVSDYEIDLSSLPAPAQGYHDGISNAFNEELGESEYFQVEFKNNDWVKI